MTEHPPVGSVTDEAARLVDALGEWARTRDEGYADAAGDAGPAGGGGREPDPGHCTSCGAATGVGRAESCRVCPVCQGITVLRSVRPETVDRLADLAGAVAAGLRDLAAAVRERADDVGEGPADEPPPSRTRPRSPAAQDIPVTDDENDEQENRP